MTNPQNGFFTGHNLDIMSQDALPDWVKNFYATRYQILSRKNNIQHFVCRIGEEYELDFFGFSIANIAKYLFYRADYGVIHHAIAVVVEPVGNFSGVRVDCAVVVVAVVGIDHIR